MRLLEDIIKARTAAPVQLQMTPDTTECKTDVLTRRIVIPEWHDEAVPDWLIGYVLHEVAHINHSDPAVDAVISAACADEKSVRISHYVCNAIEDVRIEPLHCASFPNDYKYLQAAARNDMVNQETTDKKFAMVTPSGTVVPIMPCVLSAIPITDKRVRASAAYIWKNLWLDYLRLANPYKSKLLIDDAALALASKFPTNDELRMMSARQVAEAAIQFCRTTEA